MGKEIKAKVKIQLPGGAANPGPPVATTLGPLGVNLVLFCKMFNEKTKGKEEFIIPTVVTVYKDNSFDMQLKSPPAAMLLKRAAGIAKASPQPNREKVAKISMKKLEEIAKIKMEDLNAYTLESAMKIIEGTARNMGIEVIEDEKEVKKI